MMIYHINRSSDRRSSRIGGNTEPAATTSFTFALIRDIFFFDCFAVSINEEANARIINHDDDEKKENLTAQQPSRVPERVFNRRSKKN